MAGYYSDATGKKLMEGIQTKVGGNNETIANLERVMTLIGAQNTGGVYALPGVQAASVALGEKDIAEINSVLRRTALADAQQMKGSLSDSDRKYLDDMQPGTNMTRQAALNIASARINVLKRQNDFELSRAEANAAGEATSFMREWQMYSKSVSIRDQNAPDFSTWKANRPRFDASGRRVN